MTAKINDELQRILSDVRKVEPQREVPVIITVKPGADLAELERKGLKIRHIFESISAVAGTLAADKVDEIARLDEVERIEYDSEVSAL